MKTQITIVSLVLLLAATSCASRKKTIAPTPATTYEWLTAKVDIDAEGNGMAFNDLSGQLRMAKDSIVWLSVTAPLGIEVARIKVSNDSVWVLNKVDKTYLAESLDDVSSRLKTPISLPIVQNMLLDNNEGIPPTENQSVLLKNLSFGNFAARVKYTNIKLDKETTFPLKITDKMERVYLPKRQ